MSDRRNIRKLIFGYGIAVTSFACLLAIYSKLNPLPSSVLAAKIFAVSIPLSIASALFSQLLEEYPPSQPKTISVWIVLISFGLSQLGCFAGIVLFLVNINRGVACLFAVTSLTSFVVFTSLHKIVEGKGKS